MDLEKLNLIIGILSFIAAIYAIIYTHWSNKIELVITNTFYNQREEDPFLVGFTIKNLSSKPLSIENVEFLSTGSDELMSPIIGFKPTQTYFKVGSGYMAHKLPDVLPPYWYEKTLNETLDMQPNSEESFSYYFNPIEINIKLKITLSNKTFFSSKKVTKLFPITLKHDK